VNAAMYPILLVEGDPYDIALIQRAFDNARMVNPLGVIGDGEQGLSGLKATSG
jgi:hypothetical protein